MVRMIKPMNSPSAAEIKNESTTVLKKYAQVNVAKTQVASTVMPMMRYRFSDEFSSH